MEVVVKDANIVIDCYNIGILEKIFDLGFDIKTTDFIISEIVDESQQKKMQEIIDDGKLTVVSLSPEEIIDVSNLKNGTSGLSIQDCSVWYLADKEKGILLTGDGGLRKIVKGKGTRVHGILWLLDELVRLKKLNFKEACEKLKLLTESNKRLPREEIKKRKELWCGSEDAKPKSKETITIIVHSSKQ